MPPHPRPQCRAVGPEQLGFASRARRAQEARHHPGDATGAPRRVGRRRDVGLQRPAVRLTCDQADALGKGGPGMIGGETPRRHRLGVDDGGQQAARNRSKRAAGERPCSDQPREQAVRRLEQLRQIGGRLCREPGIGELHEGAAGAIGGRRRRRARTFCCWRYASGSRCAAALAISGRAPISTTSLPVAQQERARRRQPAGPVAQSVRIRSVAHADSEGRGRRAGPPPSGCTRRSPR